MTHRGVLGWRPAAALLASAVLAFAVLPQPRPAHAAPLDGVCDDLRAEAEAFDGRLGFVVLDLTDGTRCSSSSDEVFRMASLYKLIVLAEAYAQEEAGTFSFEEPIVVLRPAAPDAEDGSPRTLTMSAREAARLMDPGVRQRHGRSAPHAPRRGERRGGAARPRDARHDARPRLHDDPGTTSLAT